MAKILGSTTTYHGTEHPYLRGLKEGHSEPAQDEAERTAGEARRGHWRTDPQDVCQRPGGEEAKSKSCGAHIAERASPWSTRGVERATTLIWYSAL